MPVVLLWITLQTASDALGYFTLPLQPGWLGSDPNFLFEPYMALAAQDVWKHLNALISCQGVDTLKHEFFMNNISKKAT